MSSPEGLAAAVRAALGRAGLPERDVELERPRQRAHGDYSTNVALTLAKPVGRPPREIAQTIVAELGEVAGVETIAVAGPGFINFHLAHGALQDVVRAIVAEGPNWGRSDRAGGARVNIEFVSANPTGPLHVGHGRQAAVGDAVANLLEAVGWKVVREYYFNDAGRQMRLFGESVAAVARGGEPPVDGYHGEVADNLALAELQAETLSAPIPSAPAETERIPAGASAMLESMGEGVPPVADMVAA